MILGGLAANTGFAAAEIDAMDDGEALGWWRALAAYNEAAQES
ncbi:MULTISPECIES: hypothetical protein [Xanthobacter]|nr:hypothetical protein [Xanthobacter autotrophicus]